jgi:beta-glucosidase
MMAVMLSYACTPSTITNEDIDSTTIDKQVAELLAKMTIEEKVGQMTQVTLGVVMTDGADPKIDEKKLREALLQKHVGSILNVNGHAFSIAEWHDMLNTMQDIATKEGRLAIPLLYGIDAVHGATYINGGTLFPHNIGMAATRNPELAKRAAQITAMETRASGIRWNFDPVLDMGRQPLWSRFEETFGEDVYLTSTMGAAVIKGYEDKGLDNFEAVASCMKHYLGYSVPASGKDRTPAYIPDTQLREIFLPPFKTAVDAGASTVMINSAEINGVPVHASSYYLKTILRDELGFKGLAVSDWEDIVRLHSRHRIAATPKEAVKIAVNAGIDMSMVPMDYSFYDYLVELVKEKEVSEERINEAVSRILKLKFELGLFSNAYTETEAVANFARPEYQEVAKQAALESITLLKNENNVLPLSKSTKVLVAGPAANSITSIHSSWSYTWQGNNAAYYPKELITISTAMANMIGEQNVICKSVEEYANAANFDSKKLMEDAKKVDFIVLCLGEKAYAESPGVIDDLNLDQNQIDLAKAAIATGKPVILILAQGRPRIISSFVDGVKGVLLAYRPGNQGANAIADILFGDYNPNGILPFTYPQFAGDIVHYDHKYTETIREDIPDTYSDGGYRPQWPFGFGLSYTTFSFENLIIDKTELSANDSISISVDVKNTGKMDGMVAVEMYVKDLYASITPSFKKLKAVKKISLKVGEQQSVSFTLAPQQLSFINAEGARVVEPGAFTIEVGGQSVDFKYSK